MCAIPTAPMAIMRILPTANVLPVISSALSVVHLLLTARPVLLPHPTKHILLAVHVLFLLPVLLAPTLNHLLTFVHLAIHLALHVKELKTTAQLAC